MKFETDEIKGQMPRKAQVGDVYVMDPEIRFRNGRAYDAIVIVNEYKGGFDFLGINEDGGIDGVGSVEAQNLESAALVGRCENCAEPLKITAVGQDAS